MSESYAYKIVLVGEAGVGKTHILNRYIKNSAPLTNAPTIGVQFATQTIALKNGGKIQSNIWDTAGQEKYRSITSAHYRRAVGAMLVYDITKEQTFESILKWLEEIQQHAEPDLVIMLIGNKLDLIEKTPNIRQVKKETAVQFAKDNGLLFEETSAYNSININDSFQRLVQEIYDVKNRLLTERGEPSTQYQSFQMMEDDKQDQDEQAVQIQDLPDGKKVQQQDRSVPPPLQTVQEEHPSDQKFMLSEEQSFQTEQKQQDSCTCG